MAGDDRGRPIDALLDGGDRKRGSNLLAVSGSESGSHKTLRWRDSNPRSPVAADSISGAKSDFPGRESAPKGKSGGLPIAWKVSSQRARIA